MNRRSLLRTLIAVSCMANAYANAQQNSVTLMINVDGATAGKGQALLSIFSSEESFLKEPVIQNENKIDMNGQAVFKVELAPARYAVSVVYDEDSNGELNTGLFGIPKELVGFSNNAKGKFGPPSFKKASIDILESRSISISLGRAK